jgi:hypothetical protein
MIIAKYTSFSKYLRGPVGYTGLPGVKGDTAIVYQNVSEQSDPQPLLNNEVTDKRINLDLLSDFYETTKETIERHENEIDKLVSLLNYAFIDKLLFNFRKDVYAIKQINEFKNNVTQDVFPIMAQLFNSLNINYTQNHTLTFIDSMLKIEINRKLSLISDIKQLLDTCDISDKGNTIFELDKIQNSLLKIKI